MTPKEKWLEAKAIFSENSLIIDKQQVMQDWESEYMRMLASIVSVNGGKILELGLGMGISANFIQEEKIDTHVIIEAHPEVIKFGNKKFKQQIKDKRIEIIEGFWDDVTKKINGSSFDGILFDTFPLTMKDDEIPFLKEAYRLLKKGGVFTFYSNEVKKFPKKYEKILRDIGFSKIDYKFCEVTPPQDCFYWKKNTIVAPIIIK